MQGRNQFNTSNAGDEEDIILSVEEAGIPAEFALNGNYPNPFNPATTIEFSLKSGGTVNLTVYNVAGQKIRELVQDISLTPGVHSVFWDGHDDNGQPVSSGVYISLLRMGNNIASRSMMLVK